MAEGEKMYIADKLTLDKILALLMSGELGLAALRGLILDSAGTAQETSAGIDALGEVLGAVKGYLEDNANGLGAIKAAVDGRADAATAAAVKSLLENGTYGLNALKAAITGRANETTATAIKSLLENGTYGLNALKTVMTAGGVRTVKSVQRGLTRISDTTTYYQDVKISSVDMGKAILAVSPYLLRYSSNGTISPIGENIISTGYLLNSTTIRLMCHNIGSGIACDIVWQIIEFY